MDLDFRYLLLIFNFYLFRIIFWKSSVYSRIFFINFLISGGLLVIKDYVLGFHVFYNYISLSLGYLFLLHLHFRILFGIAFYLSFNVFYLFYVVSLYFSYVSLNFLYLYVIFRIFSFNSILFRIIFWKSLHLEVASDTFCFLINSSWLLIFSLVIISFIFIGFNIYCWTGIHFS